MNPHRKNIAQLLQDDTIDTIIIENKDRLARMNAELIIAASNKDIIIANSNEPEYNEVQDVIDFMTSFYDRQHGKSSARNRAKKEANKLFNK